MDAIDAFARCTVSTRVMWKNMRRDHAILRPTATPEPPPHPLPSFQCCPFFQVGRDSAQELFEKAREWFVNRPIAISRQIREMVAAVRRPPSVADTAGDTFLTGLASGDDDQGAADVLVLPQTSHGRGRTAADIGCDVLPALPPIGDPRRRSWYLTPPPDPEP
jgi:hypothetical protein